MSSREYIYYPGCSLKGSGRHYEESLLALFDVLGVRIRELDDWNCCGATTYMSIDEPTAFALAARNLALAEEQGGEAPHVVAPCSACYMVLTKAKEYLEEYPDLGSRVKDGLSSIGRSYRGRATVRHPLDVLVNDIGVDALRERIHIGLEGLRVVPYYGCLIVRPYSTFDDGYNPVTLDGLLEGMGAEVLPFSLKTRCCGGSLMGTLKGVSTRLTDVLLLEALKVGAEMIVTVCPLCQFNLEVAQLEGSTLPGEIPVLFFTQIVGFALGIQEEKLGLSRQIISPEGALNKVRGKEVSRV